MRRSTSTVSQAFALLFRASARSAQAADSFAAEVASALRAHTSTNPRLAVDTIIVHGLRTLEVMEHIRPIKEPHETLAMRWAIDTCEASDRAMEHAAQPGLSEEGTRLRSSGLRIVHTNEILTFDTDLVGCCGICSEISHKEVNVSAKKTNGRYYGILTPRRSPRCPHCQPPKSPLPRSAKAARTI